MLLPLLLVMTLTTHPGIPPVQLGRFESEGECSRAAGELLQDIAEVTELVVITGARGRFHAHFSCLTDT